MSRHYSHGSLLAAFLLVAACSAETPKAADTVVPADTAAATIAPAPAPAAATGMLDPNTAGRADLAGISGMTDSLAGAVIAARPYTSMVAVNKVLMSLSEPMRDTVYTRLWMPLDLNKATKEEMLLIPGVGAKMQHEFEEYRPWTSLEQFRREIGKYVDKAELARLEQYVALK
jgi:DNA uptake protein ComE-like DNA-binding protein